MQSVKLPRTNPGPRLRLNPCPVFCFLFGGFDYDDKLDGYPTVVSSYDSGVGPGEVEHFKLAFAAVGDPDFVESITVG